MSDKNDLTTPPDSGSPGQPTGYTPELVLPSEYYEEADAAADDPSWTIVEQTDTTPIDADGDGRFDGIAIRTVRTAERVRIIQLPRVLADDDERSAAELAAEALASASGGQVMGDQVVNTTTTVYDEQGEPLAPGQHAHVTHRTTTVKTTTTTTYKVINDFEGAPIDSAFYEYTREEPYNKGSSVTEPLQIETVRRSDERSEDVVSPTESTHSYVIISKKETELDNDGSPLSPTSITVLSGDECPPDEEGEERSKQKKKKKHFLSKIEQQIDKGVMKLENILKKSNASYGDSMSKEKYEGEVESVEKTAELTSEPIRDHVNVYHSGCSDRASTSGQPVLLHKTTSEENIFDSPVRHDEKTHSHQIVTDQYEGPVYVVPLNEELNKEPIDDYVAVYHSGQSGQEEHETTKEPLQQSKPKKEKRGVGSFLFKSNVKKDYPTEEKYQGPMQSTTKNTDIEETPINNYVNVYHSGASYDQKPQSSKISSRTEETAIDEQMKTKPAVTDVGFKVSSFFKRTGAHENYPTSEYYEGPVETVPIYHDMDSLPLTEHAQVYHSGRSDEEGPSILDKASDKLEDAKDKATGAIAGLGSKVSGFFKKTGTYDVNPETDSNEGAVQTVVIQRDVESLPTTDEIIVEERIRTHDEGPGILDRASDKLEHAKDKAADKVAGLGAKVSGFFKKSAAHDDYPKSVYYEGPVETIIVHRDVDSTPLTEHVQVYHSGRSDEEGPGILDRASDKLEDAKDKASGAMAGLGSKVSGFFKRSAAHDDYPKSEYYEGPVESVTIHREVDALPLTEHVQVYHSGRSDEEGPGILNRASDKLEDAKDKATGAMADLGSKVSGFFKRSAAHDDYPKSEYYEGSVDTVTIHRDVESTPLTEHVQVYHSGRSDEEGPGILDRASDKLVDATERASDAMADLGSKVSGFFKKSAAHDDYPKSDYYEGHLETTEINREVDTLPLTEHVQVYHSGRSDEEGPSILDKASDKLEDAKDKATGAIADLGSKVSGFFKKTGTYEVNPETDYNDGAVQTVVIQRDVEYQPISENIVIEESVRTHEEGPGFLDKASDKLELAKDKAADAVAGLGAKVSGLFKRSAAHDDYPKSEYYEGPMETVTVQRDVDAFPLTEHVQVYHSGRSDEEGPGVLDRASDKLEEAKDRASGAMAELGSKVSGFFKKSAAHDDYPKSEFHEGPVETVIVHRDADTMPLTEHVQVYHSGRSDEEGPGYLAKASDKMVDATERASDAMAELGSKVSGFFKKSTAHDDYPKSEYYEGPVETVIVHRDVDSMPIMEHVQVYHSGRSDEEGPGILDRASDKLEDAKDKAAGAMAGLGSKVSGFFKKSAAHDDYPKSEYYEGQVETITIYRDVDAVPINEHVQVYHSGRSDEDGPGVLDRASDKLEEAKDRASGAMADLGSKVSGFFKRSAAHDDYPKSEYYEGSVDTVTIHRDVESTPLTDHVQVYHSGRSDEEGPGYLAKASDKFVDATERASDAMADLGSKVSGFFKKSAAHDDYPKSDYYEGPVEIITVHHEVDALPLTEHVQVYHSGRSDEDGPGILDRASDKLDDAKDKASGAMAGLGSKVSGFFKKSATYEVNPEIDSAERPVETVLIRHEVVSLPMTENVLVEHNVRSDDSEPGSLDRASNTLEDAKGKGSSALAGFSSKVSGFFKRSVAHDDYPKSPLYEGPVENIIVNREVEALPLTDYVQVYHSGRSDEVGPGIFHQASDKIEDAKDKASGTMSDLGSKVSGFFKKGAAHDDYPKSTYYDGPVGTIEINRQLDILPLTEHVQVYHSGRSDEEGPGIFDRASDKLEDAKDRASGAMADLGSKVSGFFKRSTAHEDYPKSEYYEGPVETVIVQRDTDAFPLTEHVQVYHSGRSDEEGQGILDRASNKLDDAKDKAAGAMAGLGSKVSGYFKKSPAHEDYPKSEYYDGPVEIVTVQRDVDSMPLTEHVQVYHSGRSDEEGPGYLAKASDKLVGATERASDAMAGLGSKVSGFFKKSAAHDDYPKTEYYDGPVGTIEINRQLDILPLTEHVQVYHSGRSDEEGPGIFDRASDKLEDANDKASGAMADLGTKVSGFFKKSPAHEDYPKSEYYEGPIETAVVYREVDALPITEHVQVYHSGRSDEEGPGILDRAADKLEDAKDKASGAMAGLGTKVSGFFKRSAAHDDYPKSEYFEGPVETIVVQRDVEPLPLLEHVQVYHSGRSDEEGPGILDRASDKLEDAKDRASGAMADLGSKVSGFFKRSTAHEDYPKSEYYEGPVETVIVQRDTDAFPLTEHVQVYHSGRSDEEGQGILDRASNKLDDAKDKAAGAMAGLGSKVSGYFKKSPAHEDYPKSEYYDGPVEIVTVQRDVDSMPLTEHVQVYHSGRSDEEEPGYLAKASDKLVDATERASDAMADLGSKVSGFFKRSVAHDDYPKSEYYEGPVETVIIHREVDALPLTEHVQVYHSGRSDEEGPGYLAKASDKMVDATERASDAMADLGSKVSGYFKKSAAHDDYPKSVYYEGSVETVTVSRDVDSIPLTENVQVYHSGRSDEEGAGILERASDKLVDAKEKATGSIAELGSKVSGFFKKSAAHEDYPKSEYYEGPVETVIIHREVDSMPLTEHVQVYHSGRSDEEGPGYLAKASDKLVDATERASDAMAGLGSKVSGFFKKSAAHDDYPKTEYYDGPVETIEINRQLDILPLTEHVQVYHSGRSDEEGPGILDRASDKLEDAKEKASGAMAGLGSKVSGFFKKSTAHDDYPISEFYEGQVETVIVHRDVDSMPLTEYVQVYHSGRSDEEGPGILDRASDKLEDAKDKAAGAMVGLGSKVSGFFKKSTAHDDYPKSTYYDGPVERIEINREVDALPLIEHVQVYHSGRSDEEGPGILDKASDKLEDAKEKASGAMTGLGSKVSGFFKKSPAHDDYPKSSFYEGPVETVSIYREADSMPITEYVEVYHSGRSDEEGPGILGRATDKLEHAKDKASAKIGGIGSKVSSFFKKSDTYEVNPESDLIEKPVSTVIIHHEVVSLPMTENVLVEQIIQSENDGQGTLDRQPEKLEDVKHKPSSGMAGLGSKVSGFFKKSAAHEDYPKSTVYEGEIETVEITRDVEALPITEHVQVYHSGRSDEEGPGILDRASDKLEDAKAKASGAMTGFGSKMSGFFKKGAAHDDYPKSEHYEGPLETVIVHRDINAMPLTEHVQVYHSGRSDEEGPGILNQASEKLDDAKEKASGAMAGLGSKVSGFFKKSTAHDDYPKSTYYEGPVEKIEINREVDALPLIEHVQVYHSGRSDEEGPGILDRATDKLEDAKEKASGAMAGLGTKVSGFFKKSPAHDDYPKTTVHEGPIETVIVHREVDALPLTEHVQVYHSGRSDEEGPGYLAKASDKMVDATERASDAMAHLGSKVSGFFKKSAAHEDYPKSEYYEGPMETVPIHRDVDSMPLSEYVQVYHNGRSDEDGPGILDRASDKLEDAKDKASEAMAGLGTKVSGFFKKSPAHDDYPKTTVYEGPTETVIVHRDINATPLTEHVQVYHSGRSDEEGPGILDRASDTLEDAKDKAAGAMAGLGSKVSGFFKRTEAHDDYPKSAYYEGPVETVTVLRDGDTLPINEHVQVYHSGRSDEEGPGYLAKASDKMVDATERASDAMAGLGSKVSGFFKRSAAHDDYPKSEYYDGPVETVIIHREVDALPLTEHVQVYHSGRSDETGPGILDKAADKLDDAKDRASGAMAGLGSKVSGFFKKSAAHDDYPKSEYFEGPMETVVVYREVDALPLTEHVQVYHSGRSDEDGPGILDRATEKLEDAKDKASGAVTNLGSKVSGFFKKSVAHDDYPKTTVYEGQVETIEINRDVDSTPLTEHVQVYHSGRSDEDGPGLLDRASDRLEDAKDRASGAVAGFSSKMSGFFKKSAAHEDYPRSEFYEGPTEIVLVQREAESTPLSDQVQVYHSGRSDEEGPGYLAKASDKLVDATEKASDAMAGLGSKVSGFFKRSAAHDDYPKSEYYDGPVETIEINRQLDILPLTDHVQVYHSGRSDEEGPGILDRASDKLEDAKDKASGAVAGLGAKVSGFFKKSAAHYDYPTSDYYEGPLDIVVVHREVEALPLTEHVQVYHSGRSDEGPGIINRASDKLEDAKDKASDAVADFGTKVSGFFKKSASHDDYPKSTVYEGPIENVLVQRDIDSMPLTEHVQVYHSGRSDEEGPGIINRASDKLEDAREKASGAMAGLGSKVSGFFKKGAAHDDYPKSEHYEGPVDTVSVHRDVDSIPIMEHVQVYHSGRSDEVEQGSHDRTSDKLADAKDRASDAMAGLGSKVSGFFKKSAKYDVNPESVSAERPVETVIIKHEVVSLPMTENVLIEKIVLTDEEKPVIIEEDSEKTEKAKDKASTAMAGLGSKVSGFFKKSHAHDDYPKSTVYDGQVETVVISRDIDAAPLTEHVKVYHSGRSDEEGPGILDRASDKLEDAKDKASGAMAGFGSKVSGFFKKSPAHDDYPRSEYYEGPVETFLINREVDALPLTEHVQVYHSGRSDEDGPGIFDRASEKLDDAKDKASGAMAGFGSKMSGFFKKSAAHDDYPKSEYYEGPVETVAVHRDFETMPLTEHVQVYHSGRSDEERPGYLAKASDKLVDATERASDAMADLGSKMSGYFKKSAAHDDYPKSVYYEGPVETVVVHREVDTLPLTEYVQVYHSGRSDEEGPGILERTSEKLEDAKEKASGAMAGLGSKVSEFFKKSPAHDDYPTSEYYEGPVEALTVRRDAESTLLIEHAQVYHSGRSDEEGPGIFDRASEKLDDAKDKASGAMAGLGSKMSGFFKKSAAHDDYPKSEYYEGQVETIEVHREVDALPITEHVQVYHSGRSDEEGPGIFEKASDRLEDAKEKASGAMAGLGSKMSGFFKKSTAHEDYPKSEYYEGPVETVAVHRDFDSMPLTDHVQVYHSGRSDEQGPGILDRASDKLEDAKDKASDAVAGLGSKVSGYFKKSSAHDDYPKSNLYEGTTETVIVYRDVDALPLTEHVQVYHSGRSDEEGPGIMNRATEKLEDAKGKASDAVAGLGSKVSGFFKKSHAHDDYPKSEYYEGPLESVTVQRDVDALPLTEHVQVYHSGRSDEGPGILDRASDKFDDAKEKASDAMAGLGSKVSGLFKKSAAHEDYPKSVYYEGPVERIEINREVDALPLIEHVQVYHSGRSDEEGPGILDRATDKLEDAKEKASGAMAGLGTKVSGFFKKSPAHDDYPKTTVYEGPIETVIVHREVDALPLTEHVQVYHSGRSDEEGPGYLAKASDKLVDATERASDAMADLGSKVSGYFKKSAAHDDYPKSVYYDGPMETVVVHRDVEGLPITEHAQVYHSGRSDEGPGILDKASDKLEDAKEKASGAMAGLGSKVSGLFKKSHAHDDYPKSTVYEGELGRVEINRDLDALPLTEHVQVYHSGRSDEEGPGVLDRASDKLEDAKEKASDAMAGLGSKVSGFFKKSHAHEDYPKSTAYEGPIETVTVYRDVDGMPLTEHVQVYHSGRSDEEGPGIFDKATDKLEDAKEKASGAMAGLGSKVSGFFKKSHAHEDYPKSEYYEGPVETVVVHREAEGLPLTEHAQVYHSGRSDEGHGILDRASDKLEDAKDKASGAVAGLGAKVSGLFKKSHAHDDYPKTEYYEGPLESVTVQRDVDALPLTEHVQVYHSGRSDEEGPGILDRASDKLEDAKDKASGAVAGLGAKVSGLFKKVGTHHDSAAKKTAKRSGSLSSYPESERYEGDLEALPKIGDMKSVPIHENVAVYHSGQSYMEAHQDRPSVVDAIAHRVEEVSGAGAGVVHSYFKKSKRSQSPQVYPVTERYEGAVETVERSHDMGTVPIESHVGVYHHGQSYVEERGTRPSLADSISQRIEVVSGATSGAVQNYLKKRKRSQSPYTYPKTELYEGPVENVKHVQDLDRIPIADYVTVYHSGKSDESKVDVARKVDETGESITDVVQGMGAKLGAILKKSPSHQEYPKSDKYDGPYETVTQRHDVSPLPIGEYVNVYHSGQSSEYPREQEQHSDQPVESVLGAFKGFTSKMTSALSRPHAHQDYPTSDRYDGTLETVLKKEDMEETPIRDHAAVYHSGMSDESPKKVASSSVKAKTEEVGGAVLGVFKGLTSKVSGSKVSGSNVAVGDYPVSDKYEGVLESTTKAKELDDAAIADHVTVYHSGQSEVVPTPRKSRAGSTLDRSVDEASEVVAGAMHGISSKISTLLKTSPTHKDYPKTDKFDGQLEPLQPASELDENPIHTHVNVYHSGQSYDAKVRTPSPKRPLRLRKSHSPKASHASTKGAEATESIASAFEGIKSKVTGAFTVHASDYPRGEAYQGPVEELVPKSELLETPVREHAAVYHSGQSEAAPTHLSEKRSDSIGDALKGLKSKVAHALASSPSEVAPEQAIASPKIAKKESPSTRESLEGKFEGAMESIQGKLKGWTKYEPGKRREKMMTGSVEVVSGEKSPEFVRKMSAGPEAPPRRSKKKSSSPPEAPGTLPPTEYEERLLYQVSNLNEQVEPAPMPTPPPKKKKKNPMTDSQIPMIDDARHATGRPISAPTIVTTTLTPGVYEMRSTSSLASSRPSPSHSGTARGARERIRNYCTLL